MRKTLPQTTCQPEPSTPLVWMFQDERLQSLGIRSSNIFDARGHISRMKRLFNRHFEATAICGESKYRKQSSARR